VPPAGPRRRGKLIAPAHAAEGAIGSEEVSVRISSVGASIQRVGVLGNKLLDLSVVQSGQSLDLRSPLLCLRGREHEADARNDTRQRLPFQHDISFSLFVFVRCIRRLSHDGQF